MDDSGVGGMGECQFVSGMLEQNTVARCTGVRNMGFNIWEWNRGLDVRVD